MISDYPLVVALGGYLIAINFVTFYAFWVDKQAAMDGGWRLSEGFLISLALFGGIVGAKLGQRVWRHKTRKQPFRTVLNAVIIIHLIGLGLLILPSARNAIFEWVTWSLN